MNSCVVVFGREPVPGRVKSRLAVALGDSGAARVYAATLEHTLDIAVASGARVVLSLAEAPSNEFVRRIKVPVEIQHGLDLGNRMDGAFARRFLEGERRVVVVGSDCPSITPQHLIQAASELSAVDAVLGPAADGGYWLVAQRPPGLALFEGIPWSSQETLARTRERVIALGGTCSELEELVDIDTAADLERVLADSRTPEGLRRQLRSIDDSSERSRFEL
jgi:rSAM/selenodomain-associated transferase 1